MKSAALISKPSKPELERLVPEIAGWLRKRGTTVLMDEESAAYAPGEKGIARAELGSRTPELGIVLGGDGTLLSAARALAPHGIPILGVNLGSLGFLTEVPLDELYPTLQAVEAGQCAIERRSMVRCELWRGGERVLAWDALNDAVVNKSAIARLVYFDLTLDDVFVANYKADGVIVSTPTGSTAYSLAAGGPILMPSVEGLVVTPVCPHSLTHRPFVVKDTLEISILVHTNGEEAFLSIDGQEGVPLLDEDRVVCRKSEYTTKLLRMRKTFFDVLRTKLKMGQR